MRNFLLFCLILAQNLVFSQTNFSADWEDFYSYNNVLDFYQSDSKIIALSDNALFIYDKSTKQTEKISSIHGLSGESTSAFYYDKNLDRIVIGYENGLVEIIDSDRKVYKKPDIINFNILGSKSINHIAANGNELFFSMPFGIVTFDLATLNFKNTYFIGDGSTEVFVNEIAIFNNQIYAVTNQGIYTASLSNQFLIDYHNWTQYFTGEFTNITVFNNKIYLSQYNQLYQLATDFTLIPILSFPENINDLQVADSQLTISSLRNIKVFDLNLNKLQQVVSQSNNPFYFSSNTAQTYQNQLYIATKEFGILNSNLSDINNFTEIHPEGPLTNEPFSISVLNNNLWVVYGGYDAAYTPSGMQKGISHFNGEHWVNLPYKSNVVNYNDLVHVAIDPNHENKVYISSWGNGMLVIENDQITTRWNHLNSGLEKLDFPDPNYISIRIGSSVFDSAGNLWVTNAWVSNGLKKFNSSGQWTSFNINSLITNQALGLNEIIIDKSGNKWIGSRRNGALVISENGTKMMSLITEPTKGNLPDLNVRCLAVDKNNKIWIGTRAGLRVFNSSTNIFDQTTYVAKPITIQYGQDDGFGEALLGNQNINSICVDGADNKWFGTESAGILATNPSGDETLYKFDKTNSPLPSNKILKIRFDAQDGKIYFATDRGIVAFKSGISPYGESLEEVYAYPNPVKSNHEFVTIDGRNGTHIPYGTNVKILDASGKLVYETNVEEGQEAFGGKVVWNKTNLAGNKVVSGVYIVLLYDKENKEVSSTKIAIIN